MTDWTRYTVLITTAGSKSHGSGFVIERPGDCTVVVTCDHVVADLGDALKVNGRAASVVWRGLEAGVDLAVLEVAGDHDVDVVSIGGAAAPGDRIAAVGWRKVDKGHSAEANDGTIEKRTQITYEIPAPHTAYRLALAEPIQPGYSGGPVIDVGTGAVVAVLSMRTAGADAYATAIGELRRWRPISSVEPSTPQPTLRFFTLASGAAVQQLASPDALLAVRAAFVLEGEANAPAIAAAVTSFHPSSLASMWARRHLVAQDPDQVADSLIRRVVENDPYDALQAGALITPNMAPRFTSLRAAIAGDTTVRWRCISALNALGHAGDAINANAIDEFLDRFDDDMELRAWGMRALVAIFFAQDNVYTAHEAGRALRAVVRRSGHENHAFGGLHLMELRRTNGAIADEFRQTWLSDDSIAIRRFAIKGLGIGRFARVAHSLVVHRSDPLLADDVAEALAQIATPEALAAVLEAPVSPRALAIALEHLGDHSLLSALVEQSLAVASARWIAIRALGVLVPATHRISPRWRDALLEALSADARERGQAALAIARVHGASELPRLRRAADEAADPEERVLTALALCVADPSSYVAVEATLRRSLDGFYAFRPWVARDVLDILRGVGRPEATALAESLAIVSEHPTADLERTRAAIAQLGPD